MGDLKLSKAEICWEVVNIYWSKYELLVIGDFHDVNGQRYHLVDELKGVVKDGGILDNAIIYGASDE